MEHQGVQELTKVMTIAKFLIELGLRKGKFESFKLKGKGSGGKDEGHVENGNGGNEKPHNGK